MLRRLFVSIPSSPLARACRPVIEAVESRCLLSGTLPTGWLASDIGEPAIMGDSTYDAAPADDWLVQGSGNDVWGTTDQFQFGTADAAGDVTVVARVPSFDGASYYGKAGVMVRGGSGASAPFAMALVRPDNDVNFLWRTSTGASVIQHGWTGGTAAKWLKLVRSGDAFSAFYSTNGTTWNAVGSPQTVVLPTVAKAGLAVCANNPALMATAAFTNVSVTGLTAPLALGDLRRVVVERADEQRDHLLNRPQFLPRVAGLIVLVPVEPIEVRRQHPLPLLLMVGRKQLAQCLSDDRRARARRVRPAVAFQRLVHVGVDITAYLSALPQCQSLVIFRK